MKEDKRYICEFCGTEYKDKDKCMKCESHRRKIDTVEPKYYANGTKPMPTLHSRMGKQWSTSL